MLLERRESTLGLAKCLRLLARFWCSLVAKSRAVLPVPPLGCVGMAVLASLYMLP